MSRFASLTGGSASGRLNPLAGSGTGSLLSGGRGFTSIGSVPDENADIGKGTLDITDPVGSLFSALGSFAGVAGGFLGSIGEIGVPGGPQIKNVAEPLADLATKNPVSSAIGGTIGRVGGGAIGLISGPGQSVEEVEAENRLRAAQGLGYAGNNFFDRLGDFFSGKPGDRGVILSDVGTPRREGIPPDILARLDAGESVDRLAEEMTNRGQGFSSNLTVEFVKGILLDPINVIGGLIPKAFVAARAAGRAIGAEDQAGRAGALAGRTYNLLSGGLSAARAGVVRGTIGPVTSGVLHHVGIDNYTGLRSALKTANPAFASLFDDALAVGNGTLVRAYLGDRIGAFWRGVLGGARTGKGDIRGTLPSSIETEIEGALRAAEANRGGLEKGIQELIAKVAPDFEHLDDAERAAATAKRLSLITGQSVEDAARALGDDVPVGTAQLVHLAYYGRAVDDLVTARAASAGAATNLPLDRITLISARTLDEGTARSLVEAIIEGRAGGIEDAVRQYDALTARFLGKTHTETDVANYLKALLDNDALPQLVRAPTTGKNALPKALGDWRVKHEAETGYRLGLAPESGWKAIITNDDVIVTDPFIHPQGYREAISVRNPIGRFADSLMRGVSQEILILEGSHRAVRFAQKFKAGIAPNQTRAIYRAVLNRAAEAKETPRALAALKGTYHVLDEAGNTVVQHGNAIDEVFDKFLSPAEMTAVRAQIEPTVLMMRGLEGNFNRVGATQKLTGRAKVIGAEVGFPVAGIAEHIYPLLRFAYNPLFQLQEFLESSFWNALRGIKNEIIDPDVQEAYGLFAKETDFRLVAEAGHVTHIAGATAAQQIAGKTTRIGRALQRVTRLPIQQRKNAAMVAQRFAEHGDEFEATVNRISPRLWQTMVDSYGTTDANEIARRFITERIQLARGEIDEAVRAAGVTRATGMSADEATVMEAWRESFNRVSKQAFKTHFFDPERGWLERSLNHPYLGLYPLSYMWGKVVPEFARFLLLRPFGLRAPLVGYAAMQRTQQAMLSWALVPENKKWLEDHADSIYVVELLMPGQPTDLPVNAPAWARHLVRDAKGGREITSERVFREIGDAGKTLITKPLAGLELGVRAGGEVIGGDLLKNLERAAEQFDFWAETPDKF